VEAPRGDDADGPLVEITSSRDTEVGGQRIRRALPRRTRRTVGPWCFADHIGPGEVDADDPFGVGPHPHTGLQTVTWLAAGELLHRDSLGSEQPIRPGQLNLMTAGHGVAHAEEGTRVGGPMHGIQLWVAQPETTRHGPAAFEHHADLPQADLGHATVTVLVGTLGDLTSPARHDTDSVGLELALRPGETTVPLEPGREHAFVVLEGEVGIGGDVVTPGHLAYLGTGRAELALAARRPSRLLLLGGMPFESPVVMWWNFVARTTDEIDEARAAWMGESDRFGATGSPLRRIDAPEPPWRR
jgi:hypothetical protein